MLVLDPFDSSSTSTESLRVNSSFRDDAGYVVKENGVIYRVITDKGRDDFEAFMSSGLYDVLASRGLLVSHEEIVGAPLHGKGAASSARTGDPVGAPLGAPSPHKILKPVQIPFISYPYEWSFSQFKDAALLTLDVHREALKKNMSLKDASFFNVQFIGSKPIFIDTLSFEKREDKPWVAYRQFCQHFLAPLALMSQVDLGLNRHLQAHIDGFPLPLVSKLLPFKSKMRAGLMMHLVMHAKSQQKFENKKEIKQATSQKMNLAFNLTRQLALIDSLESTVRGLKIPSVKTEWIDYADSNNNYELESKNFKKEFIEKVLDAGVVKTLWDLGGNTGFFSRLGSNRKIYSVCFDGDQLCVDANYQQAKKEGDAFMLPLVTDLANPTPAIGWNNTERMSLTQRGRADLVMALALIHHLRITANVPLAKIAEFLAACGRKLIIEFVPKTDSMVARLLTHREDVFHDYTVQHFEQVFGAVWSKMHKEKIPGSERTLYFFES
ncbi:MAG TPA: SAM-dependent methyltransferase [Deltaproteobacteria bacterium]|nr:MAG: hypothetical protein A2048_03380 [Deltaproteobacteria bacterium GWA2_45_12]HBF13424.1 SAM-dependent methyltransferase [Deltaproteobacteria bacterium]